MSALYKLERWQHGWVFRAPMGQNGIPINALEECARLFPPRAFVDHGIAHHLRETGMTGVVMVVADKKGCEQWCAEIESEISAFDPQRRWWCGLHVGKSSAAIFTILCDAGPLKWHAKRFGEGYVPRDAADFGRCTRLLAQFPEWRARLPEVAAAYPETNWPAIIGRWDEIAAAAPGEQSSILDQINQS